MSLFTKEEWRPVMRQLKADMTDEEFNAKFDDTWDEFINYKNQVLAWRDKKAEALKKRAQKAAFTFIRKKL